MNIEEYIRNHRAEMDIDKPDEDFIWTGITHSIRNQKKNRRFIGLKIAASLIFLVTISVIAYQLVSIRNSQQIILAHIDPKLAKQEAQFQNQIKAYYQVLQKTDYNKDLLASSFKDLEYIDTLINQYSNDLVQNGPNPRLLNSLMDLYQKKIKLLDRMLNEIEKNQNYENIKTDI